jgi:hypothetical protein
MRGLSGCSNGSHRRVTIRFALVNVLGNQIDCAAAYVTPCRTQSGFESQRPLSAMERACLPLLLRARLCVSLASGAAAAARDPSNAEYVLATQVGRADACMQACVGAAQGLQVTVPT